MRAVAIAASAALCGITSRSQDYSNDEQISALSNKTCAHVEAT
jgi:hypothetical protein